MPFPEDINGQPIEEYILRFDHELEAIAKNTEALAALNDPKGLIPSALIRIDKQMTDTFAYKGTGPSRAEGVTPAELGRGASSSPGGEGPASQAVFKKDQDLAKALFGPSGVSPTASLGGEGNAWVQRVRGSYHAHLPQYGQLTPQDTGTFAAGVFANLADKVRRQTPEYARAQKYVDNGQIDLEKGTFATPDAYQAAQDLQNLPKTGSWRRVGTAILGGTSNKLADITQGYTAGKYVSQAASQIFSPLFRMQNLAYLSGYQGDGPGIMGFHPGAAWAGIGQRASEVGFAASNNVSPNQAQGIYNNLFGLGWFGGSQTNAMRQGLAQITQANPVLGADPQVAAMMDQATRMGQSSISQFVDVMKQVPAAANAAHVSLSQIVNDASALGQYYKGIGGTALSGYQAATSFNAVSGLPAGVFQQLLQNPMVQGQVFMQSGLMPWEQGNAAFGNQMGGIFNAMNLFSRAVHLPPRTQTDSIGIAREVSGTDRVASLMSHYFGIDQATVKNMMQHQQGIIAGTNLTQNASDYLAAVKSGKIKSNDPAWGRLFKQVMQARDWNGKPMFTARQQHELAAIQSHTTSGASDKAVIDAMNARYPNIKQPGDLGGTENWAARQQQIWGPAHKDSHGNMAIESQAQLAEAARKSGKLPTSMMPNSTTAAQARVSAIQKIMNQHTQSVNQGPQITIGLSGTAAKFFKLSSNTAQGKAKANAGGSSVNIPYGQGPSDAALTANPETSGVSSNPTWGSSAGQSPNWETP